MDVARVIVDEYRGLDLRTGRVFMNAGAARVSKNLDYQRRGAARVRAGYARARASSVDIVLTTAAATDDFNRADSSSLGANWTDRGEYDHGIASNEAEIPAGATALDVLGAEYASGSFDDDQWAKITLMSAMTTKDAVGLVVRSNATNAYMAYWYVQDGTNFWLYLGRVTWPATLTTIRQQRHVFSQNDVMTLSVVGTTLTVQQNGVPVLSAGDSEISSGRPGIFGLKGDPGSTVSLNDWSGGDAETKIITSVPAAPSALRAFERDDDQVITLAAHGGTMTSFDVGTPEWSS